MHDFAKVTKKRPGFAASPFAGYKQQQEWRAFSFVLQKILIASFFLVLSLFFSLGLLSIYFLHQATWHGDKPVGIAILTSDKGQILKDTSVVWINPNDKTMSLL